MKNKYHVYGDFYNWTHNKREAIKWANQWNGVAYKEMSDGSFQKLVDRR